MGSFNLLLKITTVLQFVMPFLVLPVICYMFLPSHVHQLALY